MKVRLLTLLAIALAVAVLLVAYTPAPAKADAGPYHQITTLNARCSGCHRAHTAIGSGLLKSTTTWDLCTSCHGPTGGLDPVDGIEQGTNASHQVIPGSVVGQLRGGGFVNASMALTMTSIVTSTSTSAHNVLGMPNYGTLPAIQKTVWGVGSINSGAGLANYTLECTSCHDPHGKAGANRTPTYRILRCDFTNPYGPNVTGAVDGNCVPDTNANKEYIISSTTGQYYGQNYSSVDDTNGTDNNLMPALSSWCSSCHTRIHATTARTGSTSSGDSIYTFRHETGGQSVEYNYGTTKEWPGGSPGCMTCHVSHGSDAVMGSRSNSVPWPGTAEGGNSYQDSSLLRLSDRGVCEACHNK